MNEQRIKIYDEFDRAFRHVSAYVILHKGERVAKAAFKYSPNGTRTTCYLQWFGYRMVKGIANGGGYDKASASAAHAADKMSLPPHDGKDAEEMRDFLLCLRKDDGMRWDDRLSRAGFTVIQAL